MTHTESVPWPELTAEEACAVVRWLYRGPQDLTNGVAALRKLRVIGGDAVKDIERAGLDRIGITRPPGLAIYSVEFNAFQWGAITAVLSVRGALADGRPDHLASGLSMEIKRQLAPQIPL